MITRVESKKKEAKKEKPESSFMFSLAELSRMEQDRVRAETEAVQLQRDALIQAREESEARAREEARRQKLDEERAAREDEWRAKEIAARAEAERLGRIEAARVQTEAAERDRERARQLEIERARLVVQSAGWKRSVVSAMLGGVVVAAIALGVEVGVVQPNVNRQLAQASAQSATRDEQANALHAALEDLSKKANGTEGALTTARSDNAKLAADNEALRKALASAGKTPPAATGTTTTKPPAGISTEPPVPVGFHKCDPNKPKLDPTCW